jgi:hypothetical protein
MKINLLVIFVFVYIVKDSVLTLNMKLTNFEENLVYSHLKNETNLKLFYEKLIKSNDVDDPKDIRQKISKQDIENGNISNKVNICINCIESISYLLVFSINR